MTQIMASLNDLGQIFIQFLNNYIETLMPIQPARGAPAPTKRSSSSESKPGASSGSP